MIHIIIHALTHPRRPIEGNGPGAELAGSAMASILAAEFAATVLGAREALVIGGTSPLLWRHVAYGEERSAGKTKNKDPWHAGVKIEVKLELFAYITKLEQASQAAQMQFCSSSSSATTIVVDGLFTLSRAIKRGDGHRPSMADGAR